MQIYVHLSADEEEEFGFVSEECNWYGKSATYLPFGEINTFPFSWIGLDQTEKNKRGIWRKSAILTFQKLLSMLTCCEPVLFASFPRGLPAQTCIVSADSQSTLGATKRQRMNSLSREDCQNTRWFQTGRIPVLTQAANCRSPYLVKTTSTVLLLDKANLSVAVNIER